jgi:tetratricopeptide (TPR) repeat protein/serine/threonine protein kinase
MPPSPREDDTLPGSPHGRPAGSRRLKGSMRYQMLEEIARGGMGSVHRARDPELDRELALKVLLEDHQYNPDMLRRFFEEARIAGRLQHPGIVPIHDLGRLPDDRPFFTMKLVEGRTLADLLYARKTPADELQRFVGIFEQMCQAMAYAHSRSVIHRDLKPANIMVGRFGEVQVMDWGLAKVLGPQDPFPESNPSPQPLPRSGEGGQDKTQVQSASGSAFPSPPSPLRGEGLAWRGCDLGGTDSTYDRTLAGSVVGTPAYMPPEQARGEPLDERADVFALGAILCEVLTGQPPFAAPRSAALWLLDQDRDLLLVHARLEECGADPELVALARHCLAEAPGDRPAHAGVVAEKLAAYRVGVQERLRRSELERAAAEARVEAVRARARAERRSRRLLAGLTLAGLLLVGFTAAVLWWGRHRREATNQQATLLLHQADQLIDRAHLQAGSEQALENWREAGNTLDQARQALENGLGSDELLQRVAQRRRLVRKEVSQLERDRAFLEQVIEVRIQKEDDFDKTDTDGRYLAAFRDYGLPFDRFESDLVERLRDRPAAVRRGVTAALDDWCQERRRLRRAVHEWKPLLRFAVALDDDPWRRDLRLRLAQMRGFEPGRDLLVLDLAAHLMARGGPAPLLLAGGVATARSRPELLKLAAEPPVERLSPGSAQLLALMLSREGAHEEAIRLLRAAQERHPGDVWLNHDLAQALYRSPRRDLDEAIRFFTAARAVRPEIGHALAHALEDKNRYQEATSIFRELVRLRPRNASHHNCLANALARAGQTKEALAAYRRALELAPAQGRIRLNLARLQVQMGDYAAAEKACREAIRVNESPAIAYDVLGLALLRQKRPKEAEESLRHALQIEPSNPKAHFNLALLLEGAGKLAEAAEHYATAILCRPTFAEAHANLGIVRWRQGRGDESLRLLRKATELNANLEPAQVRLGVILLNLNRSGEAVAPLRKAIALNSKDAQAKGGLAQALMNLGQTTEAERLFRESLQVDPNNATAAFNFGNLLRRLGKSGESITRYRQAIDLLPAFPEAHCNLARLLLEEGRFREALRHMRLGHDQGKKRGGWPYPSDRWVSECERLVQVEAKLPELLSGRRPIEVEEGLLAVQACLYQRKHAARVKLIQLLLARDGALAERPGGIDRRSAAAGALLAASGQSLDQPEKITKEELRNQARLWLTAEVERSRKELDSANPPARTAANARLKGLLEEPAFAPVREPADLARLSSDERTLWRQLWSDVRKLLKIKERRDDL